MANSESAWAKEKGPFLLVSALYFSVLAVGFGAETPPLGPVGLFLAALTLAVLGHLLNSFEIASLLTRYPPVPLAIDFLMIGVLALIFGLLANPESAQSFRLWPGLDGTELLSSMNSQPVTRDGVRVLFHKFFELALALLGLLILWHVSVRAIHKDVTLRGWPLYAIGWGVFGVVAWCGYSATSEVITADDPWQSMAGYLTLLGRVSVGSTASFLVLASFFDWTYQKATPPGFITLSWAAATIGRELFDSSYRHVATIVKVDRAAGLFYVELVGKEAAEPKELDAVAAYWYTRH